MSSTVRLMRVPRIYYDGRVPGIARPAENDNAIFVQTLSPEMDRWAYEQLCEGVDVYTFCSLLETERKARIA